MAFNRDPETLLSGQGYDFSGVSPMVNSGFGGQFGYSPNVGNLQSSQSHVRRNLIVKVISVPNFFKKMPNPEIWTQTYIELMERRAIKIEGLNATLTVATDSVPHGGGGYKQEEITNVTREDISLNYEFVDSYGASTSKFLEQYIRYSMMDPETKFALVGVMPDYPTDMLLDQYCGTILYMEPDATHRTIVRSWLVAGVFPKGAGQNIGSRDITSDMEISRLSVPFAGVPSVGLGVDKYAQEVLETISMDYADPNLSPAFIRKWQTNKAVVGDAEVQSVTRAGYIPGLEEIGRNALYQNKLKASGASGQTQSIASQVSNL